MTAHCRDRDHWLYQSSSTSTHLKCEIWDGKRFADLSWFWDPDQKWLLPTRCVSCKTVISTDIILEGEKALDSVSVSCPQFYESFQCRVANIISDSNKTTERDKSIGTERV